MRSRLLLLLLLPLLNLSGLADYIPGELIVKFKPGIIRAGGVISTKAAALQNLNQKYGVIKIERGLPQARAPLAKDAKLPDLTLIYKLILPAGTDIEKAAQEYSRDPNVEYAEPNGIMHALVTPNDPRYANQWGLPQIGAPNAWGATTGSSEPIIGVVDTGADYNHEDLTGKIILGYDFVNNDNDPMDDNGHGTHISGIAAALTNNSIGVAGLNWNGKILAVKTLDASGSGSILKVAQGMNYAADHNARIISMSFGDYTDWSTIKDAVIYAYGKGCTLVAAAGNEDTSNPCYPAAYNDYVIAVAATDSNDKRSVWGADLASNYGSYIDVCAPGSGIWSTWPSNNYRSKDGTSMATPFVSALLSMLSAISPGSTQTQLRIRLQDSCDNIDALNPGFAGQLGHGRINAAKTLGSPTAQITSPALQSFISGTVNIVGSAFGTNFNSYTLSIGSGSSPAAYETLTVKTTAVAADTLFTLNTAAYPDGAYTLKLAVQTTDPYTSEAATVTTIDNTNPLAQITRPISGESVRGIVTLEGLADDANFEYYTVDYSYNYPPNNFIRIITSNTKQPGGPLCTWDTTGIKGAYNLRLRVKDRAQNLSSDAIIINILEANVPDVNVTNNPQASPNPFNPVLQGSTYLHYKLSDNYAVTIYLFDMGGNLIWQKSFAAGQDGGKTGDNLVAWNGNNLYGETVNNGLYFFKVTSQMAGYKKVLGSGKVIILR